MDWQKEAINDLRNLNARRTAIGNLREQLKELEEKFLTLKGVSNDSPVKGGQSRIEDSLINNIVKRDRLKKNLKVVSALVVMTERGLACLDERQRAVLEGLFISSEYNRVDAVCEQLNIEQAQLYRIRKEALYRFTLGMYGMIDL